MSGPAYRITVAEFPHLADDTTGRPKWSAVIVRLSDDMPVAAIVRPESDHAVADAREWVRLETERLANSAVTILVDEYGEDCPAEITPQSGRA